MTTPRKPDAYERSASEWAERTRARTAELNAGKGEDDPTRLWTYGERQPERDHFRVWGRKSEGPAVDATHSTMADHGRFVLAYKAQDPACLWCYEPPAGVAVATDEPEGWRGWRPELGEGARCA